MDVFEVIKEISNLAEELPETQRWLIQIILLSSTDIKDICPPQYEITGEIAAELSHITRKYHDLLEQFEHFRNSRISQNQELHRLRRDEQHRVNQIGKLINDVDQRQLKIDELRREILELKDQKRSI